MYVSCLLADIFPNTISRILKILSCHCDDGENNLIKTKLYFERPQKSFYKNNNVFWQTI